MQERGAVPRNEPERPHRWKTLVWVGVREDGRLTVALPTPRLDMEAILAKYLSARRWLRRTAGRGIGPGAVLFLVPDAEPVEIEFVSTFRPQPAIVRVLGVSPVSRGSELKPFFGEIHLRVSFAAVANRFSDEGARVIIGFREEPGPDGEMERASTERGRA